MTDADYRIFIQLCEDAGLPRPRREWEFSGRRAFRFDLAWPESDHMLALEIDGGVWTRGRHTRPKGFLRDHEKRNLAACEGWRIIYTTPNRLNTGATIELVREALLGK